MIFVAEVDGCAVAGMDAEDGDEARDFLLPAVQEMARVAAAFLRGLNSPIVWLKPTGEILWEKRCLP
jgi:hypothetical protein